MMPQALFTAATCAVLGLLVSSAAAGADVGLERMGALHPAHEGVGTSRSLVDQFGASIAARVQRLTLQQKAGQMTQLDAHLFISLQYPRRLDKAKARAILTDLHGVGSILNSPTLILATPLNASEWVQFVGDLQDVAAELEPGIPIVYGIDSVHGANYVYGATFFPQQIGMAASFNLDLVRRASHITAKDTRVCGLSWNFSPILEVATHQKWARVYESFGEDPYVVSQLGKAVIEGYQGDSLLDPTRVAATSKHFVAYGQSVNGNDREPVTVSMHHMYNMFLPPFRSAQKSGVATVMENYVDVNGEPIVASKRWLEDELRGSIRFEGVLVTDWEEIRNLHQFHRVVDSQEAAVELCLNQTGVDLSMVPLTTDFPQHTVNLVKAGTLAESRLDVSVARLLKFKQDLGLFDAPKPDPDNPLLATVGSAEDRAHALALARESIVLLKNEERTLPLDASRMNRILVAGPSSRGLSFVNGGWTVWHQGSPGETEEWFKFGTDVLDGVLHAVREAQQKQQKTDGHVVDVVHKRGCDISGVCLPGEIEEAVEAAREADVVVLTLGEAPYAEKPGDIGDLTLPTGQLQLARALAATGTPVVLVLLEGRMRVLEDVHLLVPAIVQAFLPGSEGGTAIADVLFGHVNPSGKLPISYPARSGDLELRHWRSVTETYSPLWPFGWGLSYTTFEYSELRVSDATVGQGGSLRVQVRVTNTGQRAGKEVVLLYVRRPFRSVVPEVQQTRGFRKLDLQPGQSDVVEFELVADRDLSFYCERHPRLPASTEWTRPRLVLEKGAHEVVIGGLVAPFELNVPNGVSVLPITSHIEW